MRRRQGLSLAQAISAANAPMLTQQTMVDGQLNAGILPTGQVTGLIEHTRLREIIERIMSEADDPNRLAGARNGQLVLYRVDEGIVVSANLPGVSQRSKRRYVARADDAMSAAPRMTPPGRITLAGAGDHFSAGHDIGTPARYPGALERRATQGGTM